MFVVVMACARSVMLSRLPPVHQSAVADARALYIAQFWRIWCLPVPCAYLVSEADQWHSRRMLAVAGCICIDGQTDDMETQLSRVRDGISRAE